MDKPKKYTFVISDETVLNSYGFRVMTEGIELKQYTRNPIVIWWHKRPGHDDWGRLPIGLASNVRKDGTQLIADIHFDPNDEWAKKLESKVDGGFLRMVSPGLEPIKTSNNPEDLLPNQAYETLLESKLVEISLVDIGANDNALRLYKDSKLVTLSPDGDNSIVPKLDLSKNNKDNFSNTPKNKNMEFMKQVAILLAMNPDASQESIVEALKAKVELAAKSQTIQLAHDELAKQVKAISEAGIIALVDANQDKKFTADKREQMITLGKNSGLDTLKSVLDMMPSMQKPGDVITLGNNGGAKKIEKFEDLLALGKESVEKYRTENKESYVRLYRAHYGYAPSL